MLDDSQMKVGVAQIETALGEIEMNKRKHLELIAAARQRDLDILVFPELSLTGYSVGHRAVDLALHRHDPVIEELAAAAGPMWTTFGLIEEGVAAQLHNSAITVRDGGIAFIHRKLQLASYGWLEEEKHFAEGRYIETFDLASRPWRAGTLICADLWNPALVHLTAVHGATVLQVPIASADDAISAEFSNPDNWRAALRVFAMIYGMPLLVANLASREGNVCFWGGSRILDPYGNTLVEAHRGEDLISTTIDYQAVKKARYQLPTVRDSNLDLIHREAARLVWNTGVPAESRRF